MNNVLFDVVVELINSGKNLDSIKPDLLEAIRINTHSVELSVLNKLRYISKNKELPDEIGDMVNNVADSIDGDGKLYLNNRSRLVAELAKEIFRIKNGIAAAYPSDQRIDEHYRFLAVNMLNRLEPLIKEESRSESKRLLDAFYFSIKGVESELLSDEDVDNICHAVMMDVNNTILAGE